MGLARSLEELKAREEAAETGKPGEVPGTEIETPAGGAETGGTPPATETSKPNPEELTWLGNFNETFKTQYKTKEEVDTLISRARMADELEPKAKLIPEFEQREREYKEKLEKASSLKNPLSYFSSPDAYKAEQLKIKHPDKNPRVLQEVVTSDLSKMDNVDVIVKGLMLTDKELTEEDALAYVHEEYKLDESDPADWSQATKTRLKIKANEVRRDMELLKKDVPNLEVLTDEQIEKQATEAKAKRETDLAPNAEAFAKFDKFVSKIDDETTLELTVPDEYKATLPDVFKGYFLDGNLEYNEENLQNVMEIRDAMLLYQNIPMVYKAIKDDIMVKLSKETDAKLGNEVPPASQTNVETATKLPGFHEFAEKNK